jgi:hypothetical protein
VNPVPDESPPAYQVHRGVLLGVAVVACIAFVVAVAVQVPPLVQWIVVTARAARLTWLGWNWHAL